MMFRYLPYTVKYIKFGYKIAEDSRSTTAKYLIIINVFLSDDCFVTFPVTYIIRVLPENIDDKKKDFLL